jgi:hypothetical protein
VGRKRLVIIDPMELLRGIADQYKADERYWKKRSGGGDGGWSHERQHAHAELTMLEKYGTKCNVADFLNRNLRTTERIRAQQTLQQLEADGLVSITGQRAAWVKVTPEGKAALKRSTEPAIAEANKSTGDQ